MWTCPKCQRVFRGTNQSHMCVNTTIDDLFAGRPEELILAFDKLLIAVLEWEPNNVGAAKHSLVFTNERAWLILKPMAKQLDLKIYLDRPLPHDRVFRSTLYGKKYAHHFRVKSEEEIDEELLSLLRIGFNFGMRE